MKLVDVKLRLPLCLHPAITNNMAATVHSILGMEGGMHDAYWFCWDPIYRVVEDD